MIKKKELKKILKMLALKTFHEWSDDTNYQILELLEKELTIDKIADEIGLSRGPTEKRINNLERVGLLTRDRGKGKVFATEVNEKFEEFIEEITNIMVEEAPKHLEQYLINRYSK